MAEAFGRATAAANGAARWLPELVREHVGARLAVWDGHPMGPSRAWLGDISAKVPAADVAAARLALLTAPAPYQVTAADVAAVREQYPADRSLIELTSWAALAAALTIGRNTGARLGRWSS